MIPETEMIVRLLVAAGFGLLVGFERERHNQPAGLRTHIILATGSALAMLISIHMATGFLNIAPNGDPGRLAAQVVSGVGFLGGGAILRYGTNIKGLTTAASLWTMAVVGLAAGAGMYLLAAVATGLLLVALFLLELMEKRLFGPDPFVTLQIRGRNCPGLEEQAAALWKANRLDAHLVSVQQDFDEKVMVLEYTFRAPKAGLLKLVNRELPRIEGVEGFRLA